MSAAAADAVPSPCNSVCRIDARTGWCEGCMRSLDEIVGWSTLSDTEKREVLSALASRHTAPATSLKA